MNLELSEVNAILSDLNTLRRGKPVSTEVINEVNSYGDQGSTGLEYEVYETSIDNLFIKLKITTDSYGDNECITGVEFVRPTTKTVTIYETIK